MALVYLNYLFIIVIIYGIYQVKYNNNPINKNHILVFLTLTLIMSSVSLYGYINKKNQMNQSTENVYSLFTNALSETRYSNEIETMDDVRKLMSITQYINENLEVLAYNLEFSDYQTVERDDEFYLLIKDLNTYLSHIIFQHNQLFAKETILDEALLEKYSKLKIELNILEYYFGKVEFITRSRTGVKRYLVISKDKDFDWSLKIRERIENIGTLLNEY